MKYVEINKKFTEAVAKYMMKGYHINSNTMGGSQGEIAKIDLTDGNEVIRILLDKNHEHIQVGEKKYDRESVETVTLIIGKVVYLNDMTIDTDCVFGTTIWNDSLETIEEYKFYMIIEDRKSGNDEYSDNYDEVVEIYRKRNYRMWHRPYTQTTKRIVDRWNKNDEVIELVKPIIRRKLGIKRVVADKVEVMQLHDGGYRINYDYTTVV